MFFPYAVLARERANGASFRQRWGLKHAMGTIVDKFPAERLNREALIRAKRLRQPPEIDAARLIPTFSHVNLWSGVRPNPANRITVFDSALSEDPAEFFERARKGIEELEAKEIKWSVLWWFPGASALQRGSKVQNLSRWKKVGVVSPNIDAYTVNLEALSRLVRRGLFPVHADARATLRVHCSKEEGLALMLV